MYIRFLKHSLNYRMINVTQKSHFDLKATLSLFKITFKGLQFLSFKSKNYSSATCIGFKVKQQKMKPLKNFIVLDQKCLLPFATVVPIIDKSLNLLKIKV